MNDSPLRPETEWLRQLMSAHEGTLLRYVVSLTGDLEAARDVVQDTFLRLCEQGPAGMEGREVPWLFRVARNRVIDQHRKDSRMRPLEETDLAHAASPEPAPDEAAASRDAARTVLELLAELPLRQQEVVRLKFQNHLSYEEISAITSLSVSHVGVLLHQALKALRGRYRALDDADPAVA